MNGKVLKLLSVSSVLAILVLGAAMAFGGQIFSLFPEPMAPPLDVDYEPGDVTMGMADGVDATFLDSTAVSKGDAVAVEYIADGDTLQALRFFIRSSPTALRARVYNDTIVNSANRPNRVLREITVTPGSSGITPFQDGIVNTWIGHGNRFYVAASFIDPHKPNIGVLDSTGINPTRRARQWLLDAATQQ